MNNTFTLEISPAEQDTVHCPNCNQLMIVWEEFEAWVENARPGGKKKVKCCHCGARVVIKLLVKEYSVW